ncbi:MAG: hypothetical protein WD069_02230, partial [Planctomycetales bacterium]
ELPIGLQKLPTDSGEEADIFYEHLADLGNGSDNLGYEPETAAMVATEFEALTMRRIPAPQLIGILTKFRKRGLLPRVREQVKPTDAGFDDIDYAG